MTEIALQVDHLYKKFKKGELYDSLRDLIPALTARFLASHRNKTLDEREFWALEDVCFEVGRGEAFGIMGPNGAGKSTILKLLSGIMQPSSGAIRVKGSLSALIEVGAGFHPDLTGRENIFLNGAILGLSRDQIRRRFDEIVEFSGLGDFIDTPVKRYSTGMFARLGFSVAAHVDPDILIVDEVLSVGDFVFQRRCLERMTQVIEGGATVLFVSHNLRAMADLCQRSLLLDHGRVLEIGPTDDVIRTYLTDTQDPDARGSSKDLFISRIELRDAKGPCSRLVSGSRAYVDVEVTCRGAFERLAVVIAIKNTDFFEVFDTSTERLEAGNFSMQKDEEVTCTFALDMHLAPGTYYVSGWIHRYDLQREYDHWECAATFFVSSDRDVGGVANLYPEVEIGGVK